ncbi:hypothetical protein LJ737_00020 [Hymenobacter sp. 15J16-1T3B]|uniref:hypothetical protein n=1 Tax=Hymenobacter sp. 15J16-1T3B TaxID=2886941 RepID=UPI001D126CCC|nr:hypothetical protein [Hymenobacter sp. 15J16-1T3B]MCC3155602.1 hypothetical protein [Hymenobacter sp. 15J16-1T3B]
MPNHRIHTFLHVDRSCRIYEYSGSKLVIREGDPLPEGDYIVLPQNVLPKDNTTIALRVQVDDDGMQTPVTEAAVYDREFLSRFFSPAYSVDDRLALLEDHFGRYTTVKTQESFLDYLQKQVVNNGLVLLGIGGKVDQEEFWRGRDGRVLVDWIQKQRGHMQDPAAGRKKKSKAQSLSTASQLAVVYYMHRGELLKVSLKPSNELVHFLAGLLARTPNSIAPLVRYLTEQPSQQNNKVLNEKYMLQAKRFFLDSGQPKLAQLVEEDLMRLK